MKRIIATLIIGMTLSAALPTMARHGNRTTATNSVVKHKNADASAKKDSATAIVAFSDTTDTDDQDAAPDSVMNYTQIHSNMSDVAKQDAIIPITIVFIICFLAPVAIIGLVIYLIVKSRNQKLKLAEMAIKSGQPIPDFAAKNQASRNDYLWSKGIKNIFLGIGLTVMFFILGINALCSIGLLIAIYGVGQAIIAKTTGGGNINGNFSQQNFNDQRQNATYAGYGGNLVNRLSVDELQRYACAFVRFQCGESLQYVHPQSAVVIAGMACRNRGRVHVLRLVVAAAIVVMGVVGYSHQPCRE
jgi:predicted small integral membrane protein